MAGIENFNPRSPCGERHIQPRTTSSPSVFQSTLPMRGATLIQFPSFQSWAISIHAPHAGSDSHDVTRWAYSGNFNPRSPCGERPCGSGTSVSITEFQSTLPMRGATMLMQKHTLTSLNFNPRSPCGERRGPFIVYDNELYFNPRSPCGERLPRC